MIIPEGKYFAFYISEHEHLCAKKHVYFLPNKKTVRFYFVEALRSQGKKIKEP